MPATKTHPACTIHEDKRDYLNGWIKNGQIRKSLTQNGEPQSRGMQKKKKNCKLHTLYLIHLLNRRVTPGQQKWKPHADSPFCCCYCYCCYDSWKNAISIKISKLISATKGKELHTWNFNDFTCAAITISVLYDWRHHCNLTHFCSALSPPALESQYYNLLAKCQYIMNLKW